MHRLRNCWAGAFNYLYKCVNRDEHIIIKCVNLDEHFLDAKIRKKIGLTKHQPDFFVILLFYLFPVLDIDTLLSLQDLLTIEVVDGIGGLLGCEALDAGGIRLGINSGIQSQRRNNI